MAQLVVAAAGAAVGFMVGGPMGAKIGWVAGTMIGSAFAPTQKSQGPRLDDLKVSTSSYGTPIPYIAGHPRVSGQIVWASTKREISTTQEAGKGGGGSEYTSYTYEVDLLILLSDNEIAAVTRVWSNGDLVYDGTTVKDSLWSRMTAYTGASDQLPDPDYEAVVGTANAPAYRGRGSVFIKSLQLGGSGQIPNLTFEVATSITVTPSGGLWTPGSLPAGFWRDVARSGSLYCAVGDSGVVATSTDGITWTLGASLLYTHHGITWGGNQFCVVGDYSPAYMSPDGVNWTPRSMPSGLWYAVEWNGSLFCAVGASVCATSIDGVSWTSRSIPSGTWYAVVWNDLLFCAVGSYLCATSTDGVTWTARTIPAGTWRAVTWNASLFCAVGSNICATSPDGITWTSRTIPTGDWFDVAWNGFVFCAVGPAGCVASQDGITWTASAIPSGSWWAVIENESEFCAVGGSGACAVGVFSAALVAPSDLTIFDVATNVCLLSGISAGQFDATPLSAITRPVHAMAISQVSSARTVLEMLAASYHFDCVLSDKLYFRPRASASVATLTFDEFGVAVDSNSDADPLPLMIANELEIPAQMAITYSNIDGDYQTDTQYSDRLLTGQESTSATTLPMGFTASEGKQIADALLLDKAVSALSTVVSVGITRAELEPTDVVILTGDDGFSYRMRITKKSESAGVITLGCVADDAAVFTQSGVTDGGTSSQTEVLATPTTILELLDIPLLRDADNLPGHYVAVKGSAANWSNCALFESADDVTYTQTTTISGAAVMGDCTTTLGAWTGGNFADEASTLTVDVGAGQLSSVTHEQMLSNQATNAALVGDEIIQFRDATLVSAGVYTLRGLLRGKRGTEWATGTHVASERFVLLGTSGLRFIPQQTSDIGLLAYYKAINAGQTLSAVTAQSMTLASRNLRPFVPMNQRINNESGNTVISWDRRTRVSENWLLGSVPLGESVEAWEIDVRSGSTVLRTLTSNTASVTYTNAQRYADFGASATTAEFDVYQMSSYVGRGDGNTASSELPSTTAPIDFSTLTITDKNYPVCKAGSAFIATRMTISGSSVSQQTLESTDGGVTLSAISGQSVFLSKRYSVGRSDGVYVSLPYLQVPNSSVKNFESFSKVGEISIMRGAVGSLPRYAVTALPLGNDPVAIGCNGTNFYILMEGNHIWKSTDGDTWADTGAATGFPITFSSVYTGNSAIRSYSHASNLHWTGSAWLMAFNGLCYRTTDPNALTGWAAVAWAGSYYYGPEQFAQAGSVIIAATYPTNNSSWRRFERSADDGVTWAVAWDRNLISEAVLPMGLTLKPPISIDGEFVATTSNGEYRRIYSTGSGTSWTVGANSFIDYWSVYLDYVSDGTNVLGYSPHEDHEFIYSTDGFTYVDSSIT